MAGKSSIEWTEHTWNPIVGCSILTPGCTNCYAMKMAARIEAMNPFDNYKSYVTHYRGTTKKVKGNAVWTGKLALAPDNILLEPLRRKKPTTYFVNSMGDLFHEDAPDEWIDKVVAVMSMSPQHTFQVLTKRAERMKAYSIDREHVIGHIVAAQDMVHAGLVKGPAEIQIAWPLPNVWLGVSTERQKEADERIPLLLKTPAAVRFISAEPLLGPIDLARWIHWIPSSGDSRTGHDGGLMSRLDWVIVGGESGPNARPMHPDWARSLRDQCAAAGVPMFFKQWGAWTPGENVERRSGIVDTAHWFDNRWCFETENLTDCDGHVDDQPDLYRMGKKASGSSLDGVEHKAMPRTIDKYLATAE